MAHLNPADFVLTAARTHGFVLAGIGPATPSPHADHVKQWLADGKHGEMHYLANHLDVRLNPDKLLPGAQSVIAVAEPYHATNDPPANPPTPATPEAARGRLARYAHGDDYHKVLKKRLHQLADALATEYPAEQFRTTVDTAPALERELATAAGLGWTAKNTLLIHPKHGSYFLLGLIVTTLELPSSEARDYPVPTVPATDHCANCTRCIDACPTDAIAPEGYSLNATRCISYLTLEHRSPIDPALHASMGDWLGGCDICQDVCPYNTIASRQTSPLPIHDRYTPRPELAHGLTLIDVLNWTADDRANTFRGSSLKRIKLDMIRRNALIASGNALAQHHDSALRAAVQACVNDTSELVRITAQQVMKQLEKSKG
ncbi:MAG: tRNA epoxyqueuosine(34) reductase QueG [Algisphaera sp.]